MANFFNDINKLVNTVQKFDKLLTEKPKPSRIKTTSVKLTDKEINQINYLCNWWLCNFDATDKETVKLLETIMKKLNKN